MSSDSSDPDYCRRKSLKIAVSGILKEVGYTHAEDAALESLTERLQAYLIEFGRITHSYCELAGRTAPLISDVSLGLIDMGTNIQAIEPYSKRPDQKLFMPPVPSNPPSQPKTLHAEARKEFPSHIPDHFPAFPDPHTYIHTSTTRQSANEYQILREKSASQKRDVECALTKFIAKTGVTESVFSDDPYAYPLIANKPHTLPYLDALLLKEDDFEGGEQEDTAAAAALSAQQKKLPDGTKEEAVTDPDPLNPGDEAKLQTPTKTNLDGSIKTEIPEQQGPVDAMAEGQIDNPYLREIQMPKLKTIGKKQSYSSSSSVRWHPYQDDKQ